MVAMEALAMNLHPFDLSDSDLQLCNHKETGRRSSGRSHIGGQLRLRDGEIGRSIESGISVSDQNKTEQEIIWCMLGSLFLYFKENGTGQTKEVSLGASPCLCSKL